MEKSIKVLCAEEVAEFYHRGQKYGNLDYFKSHVQSVVASVVNSGGDELSVVVAYLHDVVEDCGVCLDTICGMFGLDVAEAVDAITKRPDESRGDYLSRCSQNKTARLVKLHDAMCNLASCYSDGDTRRIVKYLATVNYLSCAK